MTTIAFFNNKGGIGKTSLVYHLAWMYADLGVNVVAVDFDPQANLTTMFLHDDRLEHLWTTGDGNRTVYGAFRPLLEGTGDIGHCHAEEVSPGLVLLPGDLALSAAEDDLSDQWPKCLDGDARAFRVLSAMSRILLRVSRDAGARLALIDMGPNLGPLNRAALVAAQHVVIPLAPDFFSLQGLRNLGPTLRRWRRGWKERLKEKPDSVRRLALPSGFMDPAGYVVLQHAVRLDRPVQAYRRWMDRIPQEYRHSMLGDATTPSRIKVDNDVHCLKSLKHYRSLMPMAQEARKPIFFLKPADGARGGHMKTVGNCYSDFRELAGRIAGKCGVALPTIGT